MAMTDQRYTMMTEPGFDRLCSLLEAIGRTGSINRAAAELKLSYRYGWGLIKKAEERLGEALLIKRQGGAEGGGAALTEAAQTLLSDYQRFRLAAAPPAPATGIPLLMASTIGPIETGLVAALEEAFYQATGIMIRHIAAGTGQALAIAREGRADLALTHAPALEEAFVAEGYGAGRHPLMSNDFLLLGPATDPAGVAGCREAAAAFARLAATGSPFLSRGDRSGTHLKELDLWAAAGVAPAAPSGWYRVSERGAMGSLAVLRQAEAEGAYTLVDRAAYLAARREGLALRPLVEGDPLLLNHFALITVNPMRWPGTQADAAQRFVAWATGPAGQALIAAFGVDRYGRPLFQPIDQSLAGD